MSADSFAGVLAATLIAFFAVALIVVLERRRRRPHEPDRWAEMIRASNAARKNQETSDDPKT